MELHQIRYAVEIARHQSFTRAAEAIPVSVASVSEAVRSLEAELGAVLFDRSTRRIRPTPAGLLFLEHAEKMLTELHAAQRDLKAYRGARTETVALGTPPMIVGRNLPDLLRDFRRTHPTVGVRLIEAPSRQLLQDLRSRDVDLSFLTGPPGSVPEDAEACEIERAETGIALAPDHPLACRESVELSEIADLPMVISGPGNSMREIAMELFNRANLQPRIAFETAETEMLRGLVRTGVGFTFMVRARALAGGLAFVRCIPRPADRILSLAWLRGRLLPPAAELLRAHICESRVRLVTWAHRKRDVRIA